MTIRGNVNNMGAITINNGKTLNRAKMYTGTNDRNSNYWNTEYHRDRNLHIEISTHIKRNK